MLFLSSRSLIVHRDALGYGLTLSGDKPVFVQTVRQGGAASRAGIRENDVIIRVNGTRVTESTHNEVVHQIQGKTQKTILFSLFSFYAVRGTQYPEKPT